MRHETMPSLFLWTAAFATLFLLAETTGHAQVSGGTDVNLSQKTQYQSECAIAKNPSNKMQLFALCNNQNAPGLFAARSTNGGVTWTYPDPGDKTIADGNAGQGPAACCDPSLAWDSFGNLFITYIDSGLTTIVTLLSTDGGATFSTLASFGPFCVQCVDQPTVVAANTSAAGAPVAVWIVWHQLPSGSPTGPMVARGAAVTGLNAVGAFGTLQTIPGTANCSYGDIAISPAGVVVQACQNPSTGSGAGTIFVNTKADGLGPNPFGAAVIATTTNVGAFDFIPAQSMRSVDAEAGLAFDSNSMSPHFGRLYLVYTQETAVGSGDTDIMLRFSDDNGATWSVIPIRVNDDPVGPIRSQFFPKVAVNPLSGNIAVCWHDCRNSATNTAMQEFCTIATPSGPSPSFMANAQISDGASTASGNANQFGDYSGLAYFQGLAHPIWGDTSNSTGNNPDGTANFDAYTDRVTGGAAAMEGDPHITTVDNIHYDFQGAGEYISLRDYDGLEIQTRQTPVATTFQPGANPYTGLATCVSLNSAVAARVGTHRVTFEPNLSGAPDPSSLQLRLDGVLTTLAANGLNLGNGGRVVSAPGNGIEIDFPNGTVLIVTPAFWTSQGKWYLNVDVFHTPAVEGIMGGIARGSWLPALPNGTSVGPIPASLTQRYNDLYKKFGEAWRVTDKTSLFDYAPGMSTRTFTLRAWPLQGKPCVIPKSPPAKPTSPGRAQELCHGIVDRATNANCVFDVTVTGEPGFAKLYLLSQQIQGGSTTTTVSADREPTQFNGPVTFAANVASLVPGGKGAPAGTLQFILDGKKAGEPVRLDANGRATWTTSSLAAGTHQVAAAYVPAPGSVFLASSSLDEPHTVASNGPGTPVTILNLPMQGAPATSCPEIGVDYKRSEAVSIPFLRSLLPSLDQQCAAKGAGLVVAAVKLQKCAPDPRGAGFGPNAVGDLTCGPMER